MNEHQLKYLLNAQEYAKYKNGLCISLEYINSKIKLTWKCSNLSHLS